MPLLYSERSQTVTAGTAEFMLCAVGGVAVGTDPFQFSAAHRAELHGGWVLEVTFPALHGCPHRTVERKTGLLLECEVSQDDDGTQDNEL